MKLHILSDLHNEFDEFEYQETDSDVVILAGDIGKKSEGVEWANNIDKPVIYVLGNHEFYGSSYPDQIYKCKESANPNVHVLENEYVTIGDVNFLGCTLWTDFELFGNSFAHKILCENRINDYKLIRDSDTGKRLRPHQTQKVHEKSLEWLETTLYELQGQKNVIVSHMAPSIHSSSFEYRNDALTAAFASDLESFIEYHKPLLWVHGHMHSLSDYDIGNTRVLCDPRGYPHEMTGFNPKLVVEIP